MKKYDPIENVLDTLTELVKLHSAAATAAEHARSMLAEYKKIRLHNMSDKALHGSQSTHDLPLICTETFTIQWHGHNCRLGPSIQFKLIERLSRRPDRYYPYDILMDDVWDGRRSNTAVRSAIKRLRRSLCNAGMSDLAAAIKGRGEYNTTVYFSTALIFENATEMPQF